MTKMLKIIGCTKRPIFSETEKIWLYKNERNTISAEVKGENSKITPLLI
jgi:hypothetical protein